MFNSLCGKKWVQYLLGLHLKCAITAMEILFFFFQLTRCRNVIERLIRKRRCKLLEKVYMAPRVRGCNAPLLNCFYWIFEPECGSRASNLPKGFFNPNPSKSSSWRLNAAFELSIYASNATKLNDRRPVNYMMVSAPKILQTAERCQHFSDTWRKSYRL